MSIENAKKLSDMIVSWVGVIALILGGFWTLAEYASHVQENRVSRSLELLNRFNTDLSESRMRLAMQWENASESLNDLRQELVGKNTDKIRQEYYQFVATMLENEKSLADITRILFFTDELVICVESKICDETVIRDYMGEFGKAFFNQNYPIICELRHRWNDPSIADRLQRFFANTSTANVCSVN